MDKTDHDRLRQRIELVNRCSDLEALAKSAKGNLKREHVRIAKADLVDLRNRTEVAIDEVERYLTTERDASD